MKSAWLGFLPGLLFSLGTLIILMAVGFLFGASIGRVYVLTEREVKPIGSHTDGMETEAAGSLIAGFSMDCHACLHMVECC
jgi:hypothetical protein